MTACIHPTCTADAAGRNRCTQHRRYGVCPECGTWYPPNGGGHCRGGAYGGCCRTFRSDSAFDAHRTGDWDHRGCIDVTTADGWRNTDIGWTAAPPMTAAEKGRAQTPPKAKEPAGDLGRTPEGASQR